MRVTELSLEEAIEGRRSVRGFLDRQVPLEVLEHVFELAQKAPSNCNVQPWQVYVATGELKDQLRDEMLRLTREGVEPNPDYSYRGDFADEHRQRQVACAVALYSAMGVERHDREGRRRAMLRNFEFFDASCIAFLGMDKKFGETVALDVGMYAQNLMLAHGLHSCPMGTMRHYPDLVRRAFGIEDNIGILFGIAFGYEDPAVPANQARTQREDIWRNVMLRSQAAGPVKAQSSMKANKQGI